MSLYVFGQKVNGIRFKGDAKTVFAYLNVLTHSVSYEAPLEWWQEYLDRGRN